MKYADIYSANKMDNYITQEKVNGIQLFFKADLERLLCCGKTIRDGCQIVLWNGDIVEMCHDCFIDLFDEVLAITHNNKTKNKKYYSINLPDYSFQISNSSLIILRAKLNLYFKDLYKQHIRDDLFLESESFYIQKFLDKTRRVVMESEKSRMQTLRMSAGTRKLFFNEQSIIRDISHCYKFEFDISIPKQIQKIKPIYDLKLYTAFSNIPCRTGQHKHYRDAVLVISDEREYGFTFSFCADHLYDLAMLLKEAYFNLDADEIVNGDFRLERGFFGSACYLTKRRHKAMYKLHLNKCSVVLAEEGLLLLADKVLTSAPFIELYPIEAKQFATSAKYEEIKETERLKNYLSKEKQSKKEEIQSLTVYYKKEIQNKAEEIAELKETSREFQEERDKLRYQLNNIDKIILQQNMLTKLSYEKAIINCLDISKTDITLGVSSKAAKKYENPEFNVTYINGIKCATFPHCDRRDSIAVIKTHRANDNFCLAVCRDCADIYLKGLTQVRENKPYINESMRLSVAVNSAESNSHCYLCGCSSQAQYAIKNGYVKYNLCQDCKKKLEATLAEAQRKLNHIHLLGGKAFISEIKNF